MEVGETPKVEMNAVNAAGAKGSQFKITVKGNMPTERTLCMTTTIERFTQWARIHPQKQYHALMRLLSNPMELLACFDEQPGNKARGIDLVSQADYGIDVANNL